MNRSGLLAAVATALLLAGGPAVAQKQPSATSLLKGIEKKPWQVHYQLAAALFREGRKDEAAKWFYVGQIRGQAQVRCFEDRGGAALRGSLNEVVGREINEYLYGSVDRAVRVIDEALAWDAANPSQIGRAHV